jgi:uncharacterized protein involved in exopolysaccharide biosynthesis
MNTAIKIVTNKTSVPKAHREEIAYDTLAALWRGKWLIAGILAGALVFALTVLVLLEPRYTAEAIVQFDFGRPEPAREEPIAAAKAQPAPTTLDANALVDSAAILIRARANADAVVTQLALDKDPRFTRPSTFLSWLSAIQSALGLERSTLLPSAHELAVDVLMRQVTVTTEPRSYLVSIGATSEDPRRAATIANTVALTYLRSQALRRLEDEKATAELEVAELSSKYGVRHPNYARSEARLEQLKTKAQALRDGSAAEHSVELEIGESLLPAAVVAVPSSPNIKLILGITVVVALGAGIWIALRLHKASAARGGRS